MLYNPQQKYLVVSLERNVVTVIRGGGWRVAVLKRAGALLEGKHLKNNN